MTLLTLLLAAYTASAQSTTGYIVTVAGGPTASAADCRTLTIDVRVTIPGGQAVTDLSRVNFFLIENTGVLGGVNPSSATAVTNGYRLVYTTPQGSSFPLRIRVDRLVEEKNVPFGISNAVTVTLACPPSGFDVSFATVPTASPSDCRTLTFQVRVTNDAIPVANLVRTNFFLIEGTGNAGGVNPASVTPVGNLYQVTYTTAQTGNFPLRVRVERTVTGSEFNFTLGGITAIQNVTLACQNMQVILDGITRNCAQGQIIVKFTLRGIQITTRQQLQTDFVYRFFEGTAGVATADIVDLVVDNFTNTAASFTLTYRTRVGTVPQFTFRARVERLDGAAAEISQQTDACVVPPPVAGCGTAPAVLTLNQAFSFQAAVTSGGQSPFTWAQVPQATDLAAFQNNLVTVQANGTVTGTPVRAGMARITLRVTDAFQRTSDAACTFNVTPQAAPLTVSCGELATVRGVAGSAYTARAQATGGTGALTWSLTDGSNTFAIDGNGTVTGRPGTARAFAVTVGVRDSANPPVSRTADCSITVQAAVPPAPVALCGNITAAGPAAVAGQPYLAAAAVQNGTGQSPFTWSLNADPAPPDWLAVRDAASGQIGGTPPLSSLAATVNVSLRVRDAQQRESSVACSFRLLQPPVNVMPSLSLTPGNTPATNATASVRLSGAAPAELRGRLELTFAPDTVSPIGPAEAANPSFVNGSGADRRQQEFTIPAGGQTVEAPVQVGTVAGVITVRLASLTRSDTQQSFLPPNPVVQTIMVARQRPLIQPGSVSLETTVPAGCTASAGAAAYVFVRSAFSTSREITGGRVTFTLVAGRTADGATEFTLDANNEFRQAFQAWFASAAGRQNGGAFGLCLPVTLANGTVGDIANVTVVLRNGSVPGDSDPVSWR